MGQYKVTSNNSRNFSLTNNSNVLGELIYPKWYTFNAEIVLKNDLKHQLELKGFWDTTIQLNQGNITLLDFKMSWKGVIFNTIIDGNNKNYLLKLKGLLGNKYVLIDSEEKELLTIEFDFKWNKLDYNYNVLTSEEFDNFENKELLILTILHSVNYYMTIASGTY